MTEKLRVVVSGRPGAGKTALAQAIEKFLELTGFKVTNHDGDPPKPNLHLQILPSLVSRVEVDIVTKNLLRAPKPPKHQTTRRRRKGAHGS